MKLGQISFSKWGHKCCSAACLLCVCTIILLLIYLFVVYRAKNASSAEGEALFSAALAAATFSSSILSSVKPLSPEAKTRYFASRSPRSQGRTEQRGATPPPNSSTLIVFASPRMCPQISDLSELFCLHNPLCTTWPCSVLAAVSSSLQENNADSNNFFSSH